MEMQSIVASKALADDITLSQRMDPELEEHTISKGKSRDDQCSKSKETRRMKDGNGINLCSIISSQQSLNIRWVASDNSAYM